MCLKGTVQLLMWSSAWGVHNTLLHQLPATGQDVFSELGTSLYCRPTIGYYYPCIDRLAVATGQRMIALDAYIVQANSSLHY